MIPLPTRLARRVLAAGTPRYYPAGQLILGRGVRARCLVYVLSGRVRLDNGRTREVLEAASFLGLEALEGLPSEAEARAEDGVRVLCFDAVEFSRRFLTDPRVSLWVLRSVGRRMQNRLGWTAESGGEAG